MAAKDILLAEETLFRDDSVFNPDHVPDQFAFREGQLKELAGALRPVLRGGRATNAYLIGPPATGKTTAARLVFEELAKETSRVMTVHVNCHMHPSAFNIFSEIRKRLFGMPPPDSGIPLSKVREEVFTRLMKEKMPLVLALDDINYLFDSGTASDILYTILRAHEAYPGVLTSVFAIATSELLHRLDDRVRSVFSPVRVAFPQYTRQEMAQILGARCEAGLYPDAMPPAILERIVSNSRDLRFGIELIKQSALAAESDASRGIEERHLEKALKAMSGIAECGARARIISILRSRESAESGELFSLVTEDADISYTTFYRLLQKLKSENLVSIEPLAKQRGKTSLIRAKTS